MIDLYTTIEQSNKLIDLGLDKNTADLSYVKNDNGSYTISLIPFTDNLNNSIPAWSMPKLLNILPSSIKFDNLNPYYLTLQIFDTKKYISYVCTSSLGGQREAEIYGDTFVEVAYRMLSYLAENKLMSL